MSGFKVRKHGADAYVEAAKAAAEASARGGHTAVAEGAESEAAPPPGRTPGTDGDVLSDRSASAGRERLGGGEERPRTPPSPPAKQKTTAAGEGSGDGASDAAGVSDADGARKAPLRLKNARRLNMLFDELPYLTLELVQAKRKRERRERRGYSEFSAMLREATLKTFPEEAEEAMRILARMGRS